MGKRFEAWTFLAKREGAVWPSETLVRLVRGAYIADGNNKKVLDIGFGNGIIIGVKA